MKKLISFGLLIFSLMGSLVGAQTTDIQSPDDSGDVEVRGVFGFDNTDPNSPEPTDPDQWINVTLPTAVLYWSDPLSNHQSIISNTDAQNSPSYPIVNHSGRPVSVSVADYVGDTGSLERLTIHSAASNEEVNVVDNSSLTHDTGLLMNLDAPNTSMVFNGYQDFFGYSGTVRSGWHLPERHEATLTLKFGALDADGGGNGTTPPITPDPNAPSVDPDNPGEIHFIDKDWSVIKGPDEMGDGNYLIGLQQVLSREKFLNGDNYYPRNEDNCDGYQESFAKTVIDSWYNKNIAGTPYEQFVQPVNLANPTLGDVKNIAGWSSNSTGGDMYTWYRTMEEQFRTKVDINGTKEAFLLGAADITSSMLNGYTFYLTQEAKNYGEILAKVNNLSTSNYLYCRSPGYSKNSIACFDFGYRDYIIPSVSTAYYLTPSLVVHIPD